MDAEIGNLIAKSRSALGLTQEQFGRRYSVSGPAVFKFEKAYVKPSLDLWLRMVKDIEITEEEAVLMWVRAKLPKKYRAFLSGPTATKAKEAAKAYGTKKAAVKRAANVDIKTARKQVLADSGTPQGLRLLLEDEALMKLYKPTGPEVFALRDIFGPLGAGTKSSYRQALRLVRELSGAETA
jgi:transcriptional regulator with XRE-family HTH domain